MAECSCFLKARSVRLACEAVSSGSNGLASSAEPTRFRAARHRHPRLPMKCTRAPASADARTVRLAAAGHGRPSASCRGGAIQRRTHVPAVRRAPRATRPSMAPPSPSANRRPSRDQRARANARGDVERGRGTALLGEPAIDQSGEPAQRLPREDVEPHAPGSASPDTAGCRRRAAWRARRGRHPVRAAASLTPRATGATVHEQQGRRDAAIRQPRAQVAPERFGVLGLAGFALPTSKTARVDRHAAPRRAVNCDTARPIAILHLFRSNRPATPGRPRARARGS